MDTPIASLRTSDSLHSAKMFKMQKNVTRINMRCRNRDSCRDLFKNLKILPLQSQYILSLLLFVVNNTNKFKLNSDVYNINASQKYNSCHLSPNLSLYQKGVYSIVIKVFNNLTQSIKNVSDIPKQLNSTLKNY
jgi:hypothetical protein